MRLLPPQRQIREAPTAPPAPAMIDGHDSTIIANIPRDTGAVVCYSDRRFKNDIEARVRFPELWKAGRIVALAAVTEPPDSALAGDGVDTEPGNLPAGAAAASIKARIGAGHWRPVGYADLSDMRALVSDLHLIGIPTPPPGPARPWRCYTAHPTGVRHVCGPQTCGGLAVDADATQWWWSSLQNPGGPDLDRDVFRDDFFPGSAVVAPAQPQPQITEADMISAVVNQNGRVEVFVEKADTGEVFHAYQDQPGGSWSGGEQGVRNARWYTLGVPGAKQ